MLSKISLRITARTLIYEERRPTVAGHISADISWAILLFFQNSSLKLQSFPHR